MVGWFLDLGAVSQYLLLAGGSVVALALIWGALYLGARAGGRGDMLAPYQEEWPRGTRHAAAYAYRPKHGSRRTS